MHIEGTLEPEHAFAIGQRNGIALPYESPEAMRRAYAFGDLQSFLDIYYAAAAVLRTEQDFHDMAWAYLERAHADNVVRAEIFFDPQTHTARGVPFETVVGGIGRALQRARREFGLSAALIMCFLRHLSERDAFETLEQADRSASTFSVWASTRASGAIRRRGFATYSPAAADSGFTSWPMPARRAPRPRSREHSTLSAPSESTGSCSATSHRS